MVKKFTLTILLLCAFCATFAANYLTFTAEMDNSRFGVTSYETTIPDIQYSLDEGKTWEKLEHGDLVTLEKKGDRVLLRGNNPKSFSSSRNRVRFKMTGKIAASGSVMSLMDNVGNATAFPEKYSFMTLFQECTSLTVAPELPATLLSESCYEEMFAGCTSLTQAPELPATTLAKECYYSMFFKCTSLTRAPELPATTLAESCYTGMFGRCTGLTKAPKLPATTLANSCYLDMFYDCDNLVEAPELPATTLVRLCYDLMFHNCTKLSKIKVNFNAWDDANYATGEWVEGVAPSGTFICPKALALEYGTDYIPEGWTVKYVEDDTTANLPNYLTFTAEKDSSQFNLSIVANENAIIEYSTNDGASWERLTKTDPVILLKAGDKALLRGNNPNGFEQGNRKFLRFEMKGAIAASGSIMSIIDGVGKSLTIPNNACFSTMFISCDALTQAPELPATQLTDSCYCDMFCYCSNLREAPELPATELAASCYSGMFAGCTQLAETPELPATQMARRCYKSMFVACKKITHGPILHSRKLARQCYDGMFYGCDNLVEAPELPANQLADSCYKEMFAYCKGLKKAPELNAKYLAKACYAYMFNMCANLEEAPELPATKLAECCYYAMFRDCENLKKADIKAQELAYTCALDMFAGCLNLSEIEVDFTDWGEYGLYATGDWVGNVGTSGTFICPEGLEEVFNYDRIPEGWTVVHKVDTLPDEPANYLTFTAEEDSSTVGIFNINNDPDIQYSLDNGVTWTVLNNNEKVTLEKKGDKVLFRGYNPKRLSNRERQTTFTMTGKIAASGSVMSLIDNKGTCDMIPSDYCFKSLFSGCLCLTKAPELTATILTDYCYNYMFESCARLTEAPELPATTLAEYCYYYMFIECINLTQAPELPATTLAPGCYYGMFTACSNLGKAPYLPASEMVADCYRELFDGCSRLNEIHVNFTQWFDSTSLISTLGWVGYVGDSGVFFCPKELLKDYGMSRIPIGWAVLKDDPDALGLKVTNLSDGTKMLWNKLEDATGYKLVVYRDSAMTDTASYVTYNKEGEITESHLRDLSSQIEYDLSHLHDGLYYYQLNALYEDIVFTTAKGETMVKSAPVWVENTANEKLRVFTREGRIVVQTSEPADVVIYNILGNIVYHAQPSGNEIVSDTLRKGVYIVKCGKKAAKAEVK